MQAKHRNVVLSLIIGAVVISVMFTIWYATSLHWAGSILQDRPLKVVRSKSTMTTMDPFPEILPEQQYQYYDDEGQDVDDEEPPAFVAPIEVPMFTPLSEILS
jgi:hypothetical protein